MHVVIESSESDKSTESNMGSPLKNVLNQFADESTAHGIPRIINRPRILSKLFWFILVVAAFGLFCMQTSQLLSNYYTFNTKIELVQSEEVIFPAITLCNLNRMKKSLMASNERWKDTTAMEDGYKFQVSWPTIPPPLSSPSSNASVHSGDGEEENEVIRNKRETGGKPNPDDDDYWYYDSISSQQDTPMGAHGNPFGAQGAPTLAYDTPMGDYDINAYDHPPPGIGRNANLDDNFVVPVFQELKEARNPTTRELKEMGHRVEDCIVQCKFNNKKCDYRDFTTTQNKHYGNCFTFNGDEKDSTFARVTKAGSSYGLHLTLFIEHEEYVGLLTEESGVRLIAHPRNIFPHPEDVGLSVAPGFSTNIGIRKVEIKRLPAPYGNCIKMGGRHNYLHNGTHAYSILSCQKKCMLDEMVKRCSCVTNIYEEYQNISQCGVNERRCRQSVEKEFYSNEMRCFCPAPCQEYLYSTRATSSLWPSEKYHRHLTEKLRHRWNLLPALENVASARENFVKLKIYFEELNYELVEQTPAHTIESVSGTIGGLLGLYVGFSVITISEFFVLLYDIVAVTLKKR